MIFGFVLNVMSWQSDLCFPVSDWLPDQGVPTSCSVVAGIGSMPHVTLLRISEWMDEWESVSLLLPGICHRIQK